MIDLIEQNVILEKQKDFSIDGALKHTEKIGRICYMSQDNITRKSYKKFCEMLEANKHFSPFGHAFIYVKVPTSIIEQHRAFLNRVTHRSFIGNIKDLCMMLSSYTRLKYIEDLNAYIWTVNLRTLLEWTSDNISLFEVFTKFILSEQERKQIELEPIYTIKCITGIAVTRELNRHAASLAICERSTRYTKITEFIQPIWLQSKNDETITTFNNALDTLMQQYEYLYYMQNLKKQEVRDLLPLCARTDVYYTAFKSNWEDIIQKRSGSSVHPQMLDLINKIKNALPND